MKNASNFILICLLVMAFSCNSTSNEEAESETVEAPKKGIHEASFFGDVESIKEHVAYGSDLNVKDEYGSTPLMIAITFNKKAVALELIESGADLEVASGDGSTALISAAFFGRTEIVKGLIAKGANLDAVNQYGTTALVNSSLPFEQLESVYEQLSQDLGPMGFKLDFDELKSARVEISELLEAAASNN